MLLYRMKNYISQVYKITIILLALLCVVLPVLANREIVNLLSAEDVEAALQQYHSLFYPVCIIYLFVVVFYPYIAQEGRELLYLHQRMHLFEAMVTFLFFALVLFGTCIYWKRVLVAPILFYAKNIIIICCFCSICYFLLFAFKNITVMVIGSTMFFLISIFNPYDLLLAWSYKVKLCTMVDIFFFMWQYIAVGSICLLIAILANKKYSYYSV